MQVYLKVSHQYKPLTLFDLVRSGVGAVEPLPPFVWLLANHMRLHTEVFGGRLDFYFVNYSNV